MSGVAIINYMLSNDGGLISAVDPINIISGDVPINSVLPAIGIKKITGKDKEFISRSGAQFVTQRIRITVSCGEAQGNHRAEEILNNVRDSLPPTRGMVLTYQVDSITPDIDTELEYENPKIYCQIIDYIVKFYR